MSEPPTFTVTGVGEHRVIIGQTELATWIVHELENRGAYECFIDGRRVPLAQLEGLAALGADDGDKGAWWLRAWIKTAPREGTEGYEELIGWLTEVEREASRRASRLDAKAPEARADERTWIELLNNVAEIARLALRGAMKLRDDAATS